jgi:hypothetical protein
MADDLEQRIRERAYEIWENEGCPEGRGSEHWDQACAEYRDARAEAGPQAVGSSASAGGVSGSSSGERDNSPTAPNIPITGGAGAS